MIIEFDWTIWKQWCSVVLMWRCLLLKEMLVVEMLLWLLWHCTNIYILLLVIFSGMGCDVANQALLHRHRKQLCFWLCWLSMVKEFCGSTTICRHQCLPQSHPIKINPTHHQCGQEYVPPSLQRQVCWVCVWRTKALWEIEHFIEMPIRIEIERCQRHWKLNIFVSLYVMDTFIFWSITTSFAGYRLLTGKKCLWNICSNY